MKLLLHFFVWVACAGLADARAGIHETLKKNMILLTQKSRTTCVGANFKSCTKYIESDVIEIRLASDFIYLIERRSNFGMLFPLGREMDVTAHPLMGGSPARHGLTDILSSSEFDGDKLALRYRYVVGARGPNPQHAEQNIVIGLKANGCTSDYSLKSRWPRVGDSRTSYSTSCEISALPTSNEAPAKRLSFSEVLLSATARSLVALVPTGESKQALMISACMGDQQLGPEFDFRGGTTSGSSDCMNGVWKNSITYSSEVAVTGAKYIAKASGFLISGTSRMPFETNIIFEMRGTNCRLEKFEHRLGTSAWRSDEKSACFWE